MRHTFTTSQWVPYPIDRVFLFFANPENLPRLMPEWQRARIDRALLVPPPVSHDSRLPSPGIEGAAAGEGSRMTISFRPVPYSPVRMKWEATIVEFAWNHHFCDEQPKGPFAYWRHCHEVSEQSNGGVEGTRIVDKLVYELPFGLLAEAAHRWFVRPQIEGIFAYRQRQLLALMR